MNKFIINSLFTEKDEGKNIADKEKNLIMPLKIFLTITAFDII